ncbi:MAG TPA: YbaN family protein [Isosphaeraceae bacterium]|nr:YbaN family protein [Isosphaeraceae bacterium]
MNSERLDQPRPAKRPRRRVSAAEPPCLDIEIHEDPGSIRVYDPRVFHAGRRAFCRRLLEVACRQPGIEKAELDLASATCRIAFDPGSATSQRMAGAFSRAVRQTLEDPAGWVRSPWWRPTPRWSALTAYRFGDEVSIWETLEAKPGRTRLRHRGFSGDRAGRARLAGTLAGLDGVDQCRVSPWSGALTIESRQEGRDADHLLDRLERALRNGMAAESMRLEHPTDLLRADFDSSIEVATGAKRILYLALAGGWFAMTLVGLAVPGIPTVPCLLATSYYLARSSPRLDAMLRRTAFFGPILDDWEHYHGLSWSSKGKLTGLTLAIVVVTVAVTPLSPVALILILLIATLSLYGIARLPALSGEPPAGIPLEPPPRLALPSP